MLAHPDRALPAEIYPLIFSHLSRHNLVQLSRTCRILFNEATRHIWRKAQLGPLLALLPGSCLPQDVGSGAADLQASAGDYYARFALYAPCVEVLNIRSGSDSCVPSQYFLDHRVGSIAGRIELPALKEVEVHYRWAVDFPPGIYQNCTMLWMMLVVPSTLKSLSFTAAYQQDLRYLGKLLAKCSQLTQFKFSPDQRPNWDTWGCLSDLPTAQELTDLEVRCAEVSDVGYSWLSKLPKLQHLKLYFGQHYGELPQPGAPSDHHLTAYPHAFSTLTSLYISIGDKRELRLIMQVWQTIAMHVTQVTIETWNRICTLDMFDRLFSSLTTSCPKVSFFRLREYVPMSTEDDAPRLPVSHLSTLQKLPLRVLRIDRPLNLDDGCGAMKSVGTLFPELEELWLEKTPIKMDDLLQVTTYLPSIRRLRVCLHILKPASEPLSTILGDCGQYFDDAYIPDSKLTLELHTGDSANNARDPYSEADWEFAARILAARWSSVSIIESYDGLLYRHFFKIDEKIAFHLAEQAKSRSRKGE